MLLYWPVFRAPFVYDDLAQIVHNPNPASWSVFARRFLASAVSFTADLGGASGSTYRPLFWLSIALDRRVWGLEPLGFHVTNLALHIANGFLGFRLLRKMDKALPVAAGASLIWLALPINSEVVAWISGRSYAICGIILLLSLLAAVAYRRSGVRGYLAGYVAAALAALLSNELGILVLPLSFLIFQADEMPAWPRFYPLAIGSVLADAVYFALKSFAGAHPTGPAALTWRSGVEFWQYVAWIALPVRMSVERSTSTPANIFTAASAFAAVSLVALLAVCFLFRKKLPLESGGITWMALGLLPFCGFVTIYQGMAERYAYLASAGFAFVVAALCAASKRPLRQMLLGCVAVWLLWSGWRLHTRALDWSDPVALYRHSLDATPRSPSLNFNLAFALRQSGDLQGAEAAYLQTIELQRNYPSALSSLGELYLQTEHLDEAERQFVRAIAVSPTDSSAYTNLGVIFSEQGRPSDAARMFAKAIDNKATDPTPYFNLAVLLQQSGHGDLALPLYRKVLELKPGDADAAANMRAITDKR